MNWPHLTIYTALPAGVGGEARGPLVCIRTEYRTDQGIHAHELEHVRQWWTLGLLAAVIIAALPSAAHFAPLGLVAHSLAYALWPRYRLWAEVQAYRVQMRHPDATGGYLTLEAAAERLASPRYRLGITPADARRLLA
ncbi:MAG: hypothetical protein ACT4NV_11440 [Rhodoferax sp.]